MTDGSYWKRAPYRAKMSRERADATVAFFTSNQVKMAESRTMLPSFEHRMREATADDPDVIQQIFRPLPPDIDVICEPTPEKREEIIVFLERRLGKSLWLNHLREK